MNKMNIQNAQYVLGYLSTENSSIQATIDGVQMSVPLDPANRHYAAIIKAVEAGELVIEPAKS